MGEHDALFKQVIQTFYSQFIRLTLPWVERRRRGDPELLPTELHHPVPGPPSGPGGGGRLRLPLRADLVARVPVDDEVSGHLLVHAELESSFRDVMGPRARGYGRLLGLAHGEDVVSVVLHLTGGGKDRAGVQEQVYTHRRMGRELDHTHYYTFCLEHCDARQYLDHPEILGVALSALMDPGDLSPLDHRMACMRRLYAEQDLDPRDRALLRRLVETYLPLGRAEEIQYDEKLRKEIPMAVIEKPFDEWLIRKGREEGRKEGWERGREEGRKEGLQQARRLVLRLLELRFGQVDPAMRKRVEGLDSLADLEALGERVVTASSLEEVGLS